MAIGSVVSAELSKLRTLPAAIVSAAGTVLIGAAITLARAATATDQGTAATDVTEAVPYAQAGIILLGILVTAHEHTGGQFRTTLAAVPDRGLLLAGKTGAALITVGFASLLTVGVSLAVAVTHRLSSAATVTSAPELYPLAGAVLYLTLIGMLSHGIAVLMRHLVPALVTMLAVVLIVPPLLGEVTEHARWLPEGAGSLLYLPGTDDVLTPGTGALVLLGWIIATGTAAAAAFIVRDA